jgi:hypothetical protein
VQLLAVSPFFTAKNKELKIDRDLTLNSALLHAQLPWMNSIFQRKIKAIVRDPQSGLLAKEMSPKYIRELNFQALDDGFAHLAPTLHSILRIICNVGASNKESENQESENGESEKEKSEKEESDYIGRKIKRQRWQHRHRNKGVIVTTVLALCAFTHSNHANSFQVSLPWIRELDVEVY